MVYLTEPMRCINYIGSKKTAVLNQLIKMFQQMFTDAIPKTNLKKTETDVANAAKGSRTILYS